MFVTKISLFAFIKFIILNNLRIHHCNIYTFPDDYSLLSIKSITFEDKQERRFDHQTSHEQTLSMF